MSELHGWWGWALWYEKSIYLRDVLADAQDTCDSLCSKPRAMYRLLGFRKESSPRASTSPRQGRSKRGGVVQAVLWAKITLSAVSHTRLNCVADIKVRCCFGSSVELVSAGLCLHSRAKSCRGTPKRCCRSTFLQSSRHPDSDPRNVETSSRIQLFTSGGNSDCSDTRCRGLLRPDWLAYAFRSEHSSRR